MRPAAYRSRSAAAIWLRPALWTQANKTCGSGFCVTSYAASFLESSRPKTFRSRACATRESVVHPRPPFSRLDQPGVLEHFEMVRDGRLQQLQALGEIADADAGFRARQRDEDTQPVGIGEHFEELRLFGKVVGADVGRRKTATLHAPIIPYPSVVVNIYVDKLNGYGVARHGAYALSSARSAVRRFSCRASSSRRRVATSRLDKLPMSRASIASAFGMRLSVRLLPRGVSATRT